MTETTETAIGLTNDGPPATPDEPQNGHRRRSRVRASLAIILSVAFCFCCGYVIVTQPDEAITVLGLLAAPTTTALVFYFKQGEEADKRNNGNH